MANVAEKDKRRSKRITTAADSTKLDTPSKLDIPLSAQPIKIYWRAAIVLILMHVLSLLIFVPYFFSWTGVTLAVLGHFTFGMMGITVGYHRLLTHQGFTCAKWFEHLLAILGICTLQDSPARWVAIHRVHHKYSDQQEDPHSPLVGFFWAHMGWLFVENRDNDTPNHFERYVRDLLRDPFYLTLERKAVWFSIYILHGLLLTAAGFLGGWIVTGSLAGAVQLGASVLVWGVIFRTVAVMHGTWAVNSVTHVWGYQNYATHDQSRNNLLVAVLSHGEGWHNNHHFDQRAASHGHHRWELDMSWWVIRGLELAGIARNVVRPRCWTESTESTESSAS